VSSGGRYIMLYSHKDIKSASILWSSKKIKSSQKLLGSRSFNSSRLHSRHVLCGGYDQGDIKLGECEDDTSNRLKQISGKSRFFTFSARKEVKSQYGCTEEM